jgi:hypothetical protein
MDTILDVGEIGWSLYHRAHLQWRKDQGEDPPDVMVYTLPDRMRLYEGLAMVVRTDIPVALRSPFLLRNSFMYDGGPNIHKVIEELGIMPESVIHGWRNMEWKSAKCYEGKMTFKPIPVHDFEMSAYYGRLKDYNMEEKNIILLPRYKFGAKYTERRNWGEERWHELTNLLVERTNHNLIVCGKYGQVYHLSEVKGRVYNLVDDADPLETLLCALNDTRTVLAVSSQSFLGKLALLQNVHTLMWGHQKQRHQVDENWSSDPEVICTFIESMNYDVEPNTIYEHINAFLTGGSYESEESKVLQRGHGD